MSFTIRGCIVWFSQFSKKYLHLSFLAVMKHISIVQAVVREMKWCSLVLRTRTESMHNCDFAKQTSSVNQMTCLCTIVDHYWEQTLIGFTKHTKVLLGDKVDQDILSVAFNNPRCTESTQAGLWTIASSTYQAPLLHVHITPLQCRLFLFMI